jgi:hypothetical protein
VKILATTILTFTAIEELDLPAPDKIGDRRTDHFSF